MDGTGPGRLVRAALRCYPARWRRRHGTEAAELAALLIGDGTPAGSIALSYLAGAAREWLTPRPGRLASTAACTLLAGACALGVSAVLLASTAPARAASASQAHGRAHCRPGAAAPVPPMSSAMAHPHVSIWQAGYDRSC
ncbi:MAG TPA: hypothetical protein VGM12_01590 [Trebonia sp.]|jgi:hypothetical protein